MPAARSLDSRNYWVGWRCSYVVKHKSSSNHILGGMGGYGHRLLVEFHVSRERISNLQVLAIKGLTTKFHKEECVLIVRRRLVDRPRFEKMEVVS